MSITSEIRLRVKKEGDVALNQLSKKLNDVAQRSTLTSAKFKDLSSTLKQTDSQIRTKSINGLNDYARAWRELANNVDITSQEFREATREAQRFEREAAKAQGKRFGGGISRGGAIAGVASAGLLGPEALVGAGVGALVGSPLAGAAIGSTVIAPARRAAGEIAESVADINRFRIALAGVSDDFEDYEKSAAAIKQATNDFLLPIDSATQQYTRLKASVRGAGLGTEETTKVFRGISAAIIATGGSAEDLNSALVATSQVFSKGKVSAEELRQQIGERLPGAFTIFAQSIGKTPQELDKALENGEVSLQDFLTFSEELFQRYGKSSEILATAPENAGKRLTVALRDMQENFGGFFAKIGAKIQDYITNLIKFVNKNSQQLKKLVTDIVNAARIIGQLATDIGNITISVGMAVFEFLKTTNPVFKILLGSMELGLKNAKDLLKTYAQFREIRLLSVSDVFPQFVPDSFGTGLGTGNVPLAEGSGADDETSRRQSRMRTESRELLELSNQRLQASRTQQDLLVAELDYQIRLQQITEQFNAGEINFYKAKRLDNDAIQKLQERILKLRGDEKKELADLIGKQKKLKEELTETELLGKSIVQTFAQGLGNAFEALFDKASSLRDVLSNVLRQTARLLLDFGIKAGLRSIPALSRFFAMGGVMTANGPLPLKKYARGGIANSPQMAVFGEGSTPEAYVPLPDGRSIPVRMQNGGGDTNIVVNVEGGGATSRGGGDNGRALGSAIAAAVQAELIKQRRPGGLLAST